MHNNQNRNILIQIFIMIIWFEIIILLLSSKFVLPVHHERDWKGNVFNMYFVLWNICFFVNLSLDPFLRNMLILMQTLRRVCVHYLLKAALSYIIYVVNCMHALFRQKRLSKSSSWPSTSYLGHLPFFVVPQRMLLKQREDNFNFLLAKTLLCFVGILRNILNS